MNKNIFNKTPFFIAEISGNHGGKISNAKKLIFYAKKHGADAVKLQTYTPDMMTIKSNKYKIKSGLWAKNNLWDLYKKAHTPLHWHQELFHYARKIKIEIFSTPFSAEAVDLLEKLNAKIYKVSSFEMNDLNLIKKMASTKKPLIISTGLANLNEISQTVKTAKKYGCKNLSLLYCVSNYPSKITDFNLNNIDILKKKFKCRVGLSDHSIGSDIACMSVIKGAEIIEKHICLNHLNTVDSKFSLKVKDIKKFKLDILRAKNLVNNRNFVLPKNEGNKKFRRSIYAINNIKKGQKFSEKNIKTFRPDIGLSSMYFLKLINKKSPKLIKKYQVLDKNILKK
jgi:pseudaminic acid synthase